MKPDVPPLLLIRGGNLFICVDLMVRRNAYPRFYSGPTLPRKSLRRPDPSAKSVYLRVGPSSRPIKDHTSALYLDICANALYPFWNRGRCSVPTVRCVMCCIRMNSQRKFFSPATSQSAAVALLHGRPNIINLSDIVVKYEELPPVHDASIEPTSPVLYEITDKVYLLRFGLWDTTVSVTVEFTNRDDGVMIKKHAPMGMKIEEH